jgi:hypothetical protein
MYLEGDALGLPNDDVLLDLFGGVEVEVLMDLGLVNLLTYRTLNRQGSAICASATKPDQMRQMLRARLEAEKNGSGLEITGMFSGWFVQPPREYDLYAARCRAERWVRYVWNYACDTAKTLGGGPGWEECLEPLLHLDEEPDDYLYGPEVCDPRCQRCCGTKMHYVGPLTPFQMWERVGPWLAEQELKVRVECWSRCGKIGAKPTCSWPRPAAPTLPREPVTHVAAVWAGHHNKGLRILPIEDVTPSGLSNSDVHGFLRGELGPVPAWAQTMVNEWQKAREEENAALKEQYRQTEVATRAHLDALRRELLRRLVP